MPNDKILSFFIIKSCLFLYLINIMNTITFVSLHAKEEKNDDVVFSCLQPRFLPTKIKKQK